MILAISDSGSCCRRSAAVARKLARLSTRAGDILGATVVLSASWSAVPDVAVVADQAAPFEVLQELVDADLVHVRLSGHLSVRPAHALVGAAVRQLMPLPRRRQLHRRAASVRSGAEALDHRVAAADGYDDVLAHEASRHAATLYAQWAYRQSAHYFRVARDLTQEPAARRALDLESRWSDVLSAQAGNADQMIDPSAPQDAAAASVAALHLVRDGDIVAATRRLDHLDDDALQRAAPITRYRIHLLTAYTRLVGGQSTARVVEALDALDRTEVRDPALAAMESPTRGFVAARLDGDGGAIPTTLAQLPANPMDVPGPMLALLGWRAVYRVHSLQVREAARDLEAMIDRAIGRRDASPLQSQLALAQWYAGDWGSAGVAQGLSDNSPSKHWSPDVGGALLNSAWGRFDDADTQLREAAAAVRRAPWPEGRLQVMVARVARVHAAGRRPAEVATLAADYHDLAQLLEVVSAADGSIVLHAGLLAHWSGRPGVAHACADLMERARQPSRSHRALTLWLRGLLASRTPGAEAIDLLRSAADDHQQELPLYRAHLWADLGDALLPSSPSEAQQARRQALQIYQALGASPYEERLTRIVAPCGPELTSSPASAPVYLPALTERERDVLALLTKGLSYQQIAGQLFVTRSAVAFHLSNLYAKFGVRSRHDLTAYVLAHPAALRAS
jgi:DNA-binding CsgD family transcriptional regulator